jgi:hypothetical protein
MLDRIEARSSDLFWRAWKCHEAGMDFGTAYRIALAEEIAAEPWSPELRTFLAFLWSEHFGARLSKRLQQKIVRRAKDDGTLDYLAAKLKAEGVSNPRAAAEAEYARALGLSVTALRRRRHRDRRE